MVAAAVDQEARLDRHRLRAADIEAEAVARHRPAEHRSLAAHLRPRPFAVLAQGLHEGRAVDDARAMRVQGLQAAQLRLALVRLLAGDDLDLGDAVGRGPVAIIRQPRQIAVVDGDEQFAYSLGANAVLFAEGIEQLPSGDADLGLHPAR